MMREFFDLLRGMLGLWWRFLPAIGLWCALFSYFQFSAVSQIGLGMDGASVVVALQAIGGAAGNMISVHNVVAAAAVVGLLNREGEVIRKTLVPMVFYVIQAGLLGQAVISGVGAWWVAAAVWALVFLGVMVATGGRKH